MGFQEKKTKRLTLNPSSKARLATGHGAKRFSGFTLVEMIVAVGIFSLLMVLSVGALLAIVSANKNAQAIKSAVDNLNFSLETMARTIRTGSNYDCDSNLPGLQNCSVSPSELLSFTDQSGKQITYRLSGGKILRDISSMTGIEITAPEVVVSRLKFYVKGVQSGDTDQPSVLIVIGGRVNYKSGLSTFFNVETMAVQRYFNK